MTRYTFDNPNSDEARQALLDNKCERNHPKRHRTKKRLIKQREQNKVRTRHRAAIKQKQLTKYNADVRAYWLGQRDDHPIMPSL